jgi:hypothetical protein
MGDAHHGVVSKVLRRIRPTANGSTNARSGHDAGIRAFVVVVMVG